MATTAPLEPDDADDQAGHVPADPEETPMADQPDEPEDAGDDDAQVPRELSELHEGIEWAEATDE